MKLTTFGIDEHERICSKQSDGWIIAEGLLAGEAAENATEISPPTALGERPFTIDGIPVPAQCAGKYAFLADSVVRDLLVDFRARGWMVNETAEMVSASSPARGIRIIRCANGWYMIP